MFSKGHPKKQLIPSFFMLMGRIISLIPDSEKARLDISVTVSGI